MEIDFFSTQINITPEWMLKDVDGKSTLAEVMAWCCQANKPLTELIFIVSLSHNVPVIIILGATAID